MLMGMVEQQKRQKETADQKNEVRRIIVDYVL
jgi:hypothetical protein